MLFRSPCNFYFVLSLVVLGQAYAPSLSFGKSKCVYATNKDEHVASRLISKFKTLLSIILFKEIKIIKIILVSINPFLNHR